MLPDVTWDEVYSKAVVEPEHGLVENRGAILGTVVVRPGGRLRHAGYADRIEVEADGTLILQGMVDSLEVPSHGMPDGAGVFFSGAGVFRPMEPGEEDALPFTGPEGWGQLSEPWAKCVEVLDAVIEEAGLDEWAQSIGHADPSVSFALEAATAALSVTGLWCDIRLWALISELMYGRVEELRLQEPDGCGFWCPGAARRLIGVTERSAKRGAVLQLLHQLVSLDQGKGRWTYDYYNAVWPLMRGIVSLGPPPGPDAEIGLGDLKSALEREVEKAPGLDVAESAPVQQKATRSPAAGARPARAKEGKTRAAAKPTGQFETERDPVDSALMELDGLIGLASVKQEIQKLGGQACIFRERERRRLAYPEPARHMVMTGHPGTGKTTVARLLGQVYYGYELLARRNIREVHRSDLVAVHVGETAPKTERVFMSALGGVLFIDEAYALTPRAPQDFGQEAIDHLTHLLENHRTEIMVVIAGYPDEIDELLDANAGLAGRFGARIHFPDYTNDQLSEILLKAFVWPTDYELSKDAEHACRVVIRQARSMMGRKFDNGRMVRRLFERATLNQSARLHEMGSDTRKLSDDELVEIVAEDLPTAAQVAQRPEE